MKVMFAARAIDGVAGGVERMVAAVMNVLVARGHTVILFTWDKTGAKAFYHIDPQILWHRLGMGDPMVKADMGLRFRRGAAIRKLIGGFRPDLIVCFQAGPFIAMRAYTAGMGIPVIAAERNAPTRFDFTGEGKRKRYVYNGLRFAKRILIQSESYRELYPSFLRNRIVAIANPVFAADGCARPAVCGVKGRFRILSVGRLSYQKNYSVLVDAFAAVAAKYRDWDLVIVGEGEERKQLEKRIARAGLSNRVFLPGTTTGVADYYMSSHLFCLPSLWEGFPNALAEALAHGLPSVGFSDCAGVRDLIAPGQNGILAEGNDDAAALAGTLARLMDGGEMRRDMGAGAVESVKKYSPEAIFSLWERVLAEAVAT
jgi:GalNAc-alpha-(1->4)-GalNAc-alpha-(1->3)-diNAcBac-PP-undecaprenol alpha-1,4-N-acetyl-D-galactosaminyltransferase